MTRLPALDLMRFGAAMAVVLYHYISGYAKTDAGPLLSAVSSVTRYGYLGVDLFFMISGFVILWSTQGRDATGFVISRISRLYPSFWVGLLFTIILAYLLAGTLPDVRTVVANATMIPAPLGSPLIDGVYWTLEVEIRFYALIFLLLLTRQMPRVELWLYGWLAVSITCLLIDMPWVIKYVALQPYGAFFVAGCLFYLVHSKGVTASRAIALVVSAATCVYVSHTQRSGFITADTSSAVVVPSVIIAFFGVFALLIRSTANFRFASGLGALTYPLYLTHATMGMLVYRLVLPSLGVAAALIIITALALAVAWLIAVLVDIPARKPFANLLSRAAATVTLQRVT
jgi:peptidoglycan/LPS O-acetylase OafA/YrhL